MTSFKEMVTKKREYILVNVFLTNYKIHLIPVDQTTPIANQEIHYPYKGVSLAEVHSISIPSILSVCIHFSSNSIDRGPIMTDCVTVLLLNEYTTSWDRKRQKSSISLRSLPTWEVGQFSIERKKHTDSISLRSLSTWDPGPVPFFFGVCSVSDSLFQAKSTSKTHPGLQLLCRDMRRISLKWKQTESRQLLMYHLHLYSPKKPEELYTFEYFRSLTDMEKSLFNFGTQVHIRNFLRLFVKTNDPCWSTGSYVRPLLVRPQKSIFCENFHLTSSLVHKLRLLQVQSVQGVRKNGRTRFDLENHNCT